MIWYAVIFSLLILGAVNYEITKKRYGKNILIFFIVFFLAFSYQMGSDWLNYQFFYEKVIPNYSLKELLVAKIFKLEDAYITFEKGYVLLNYLFHKMGFNYEIFSGITLSVCIYILLDRLYKESINFYLSYLFFLLYFLISACIEPVIRQLIAVTIVVYSFKYLEKKKLLKYCIFILIAAQFHKSAYIMIVLYFFKNISLNGKKFLLLIFILNILLLRVPILLSYITKVVPQISGYSSYFDSFRYGVHRSRSFYGTLYHLIIAISYLYVIFFSYRNYKKRKEYIENLGILFICFKYFQNYLPIIARFNSYFIFAFSICMSNIGNLKLPNKKILVFNKHRVKFIYLLLLLSLLFIRMKDLFFATKMNTFKYLKYKNYFVKLIKEDLKKNFEEKSNDYKRKIKNMLIEENNNLKKE